jgi:hypothetical protein
MTPSDNHEPWTGLESNNQPGVSRTKPLACLLSKPKPYGLEIAARTKVASGVSQTGQQQKVGAKAKVVTGLFENVPQLSQAW